MKTCKLILVCCHRQFSRNSNKKACLFAEYIYFFSCYPFKGKMLNYLFLLFKNHFILYFSKSTLAQSKIASTWSEWMKTGRVMTEEQVKDRLFSMRCLAAHEGKEQHELCLKLCKAQMKFLVTEAIFKKNMGNFCKGFYRNSRRECERQDSLSLKDKESQFTCVTVLMCHSSKNQTEENRDMKKTGIGSKCGEKPLEKERANYYWWYQHLDTINPFPHIHTHAFLLTLLHALS